MLARNGSSGTRQTYNINGTFNLNTKLLQMGKYYNQLTLWNLNGGIVNVSSNLTGGDTSGVAGRSDYINGASRINLANGSTFTVGNTLSQMEGTNTLSDPTLVFDIQDTNSHVTAKFGGSFTTIAAVSNGFGTYFTSSTLGNSNLVATTNGTAFTVTVSLPATAPTYSLTVTDGAGGGLYTNGAQVTIAANASPTNEVFSHWTGDTVYLADSNSASTTVTMPAQAIALTATYKAEAPVSYTITASAGANGTISPTSTNVLTGGSADFVISANSYYRILTLTTNGTAVTGSFFGNGSTSYNFTWSNVQADGVLAATFMVQVTTNPATAGVNVPYSWLAQYGLTNNQDAAVVLDQDGDGLLTWQEYIAGTDPTNSASCLKAAQTTRNVITWAAQSNRIYSVYWSTNLVQGFTALSTNIASPQSSCTNTTPDPRVNHYQIKVRMQ
jgi:hypothetical protein